MHIKIANFNTDVEIARRLNAMASVASVGDVDVPVLPLFVLMKAAEEAIDNLKKAVRVIGNSSFKEHVALVGGDGPFDVGGGRLSALGPSKYKYSDKVAKLDKELKALKDEERTKGIAKAGNDPDAAAFRVIEVVRPYDAAKNLSIH